MEDESDGEKQCGINYTHEGERATPRYLLFDRMTE
jgi:hypothetical protein